MNMISVMQAVREEVERDNRLKDALYLKISNNRKLARYIQPKIEQKAGKSSIDAIAMSLNRIQKNVEPSEKKYLKILKDSQIQLRDNIQVFYLNTTKNELWKTTDNHKDKKRSFHIRIKNAETTTLIVDKETALKLEIDEKEVIDSKKGLTAITVNSPHEIINTPGAISSIISALGVRHINIVELTSSYDNTTIIFEKKDSINALETIREITG